MGIKSIKSARIKLPREFIIAGKQGIRSKYLPEMNRSELGRRIGMGKSHISKILSGKVVPGIMTARRLSDALGMSLDEFYLFLKSISKVSKIKSKRKVRGKVCLKNQKSHRKK